MDFDRRSNDFAAKPVRLLVQWVHRREVLQKATKKTKILIWLNTDPLRSLRLLLLACFTAHSEIAIQQPLQSVTRPGQDRQPMREKHSISFVTKKFS